MTWTQEFSKLATATAGLAVVEKPDAVPYVQAVAQSFNALTILGEPLIGPAPGAAGGYLRSDGANWVRVQGIAAADVQPGSFAVGAFTFTGLITLPHLQNEDALAWGGIAPNTILGRLSTGAGQATRLAANFSSGANTQDDVTLPSYRLTLNPSNDSASFARSPAGSVAFVSLLSISSAGLSAPGPLALTTATSKIIPGVTSLSLRNNADSANNVLLLDSGKLYLGTATATGDSATRGLVFAWDSAGLSGGAGASSIGALFDYAESAPVAGTHFFAIQAIFKGAAASDYHESSALLGSASLNNASATASEVWGIRGTAGLSAGTSTWLISIGADTFNAGAQANATNICGVNVFADPGSSGLTSKGTNQYGVKVGAITGGTLNYAWYSEAGKLRFGDLLDFTAGALYILGTTDNFGVAVKTNGSTRWTFDTSGNQVADTANGGYIAFRPGTATTTIKSPGIIKTWVNETTTSTTANNNVWSPDTLTVTIKAHTLDSNGHCIQIRVYGTMGGGGTGGNVAVKFGATVIGTLTPPAASTWFLDLTIARVDNTHQNAYMLKYASGSPGTWTNASSPPSETLSGDVTLEIQGWVNTTGTLTLSHAIVRFEGD